MESQNSLRLIAYAPGLSGDDSRPLVVVHAMERALPGLRLAWTISDEGVRISVPQDDTRGVPRTADERFPLRRFPLLCNDDRHHSVTLSRWEAPPPGGKPQFEVRAEWPMDAAGLAAAADVLEGIAEGARSFWAQATPDSAVLDIARQTNPVMGGPPHPPRGLPALKPSSQIGSPEIPRYLGWLDYWSAAAAQAIGFPDPVRDAELLSRARRTATGGWVVRLTDAPLNLDNPAHLQALLRAYERFPEIGGRAAS